MEGNRHTQGDLVFGFYSGFRLRMLTFFRKIAISAV